MHTHDVDLIEALLALGDNPPHDSKFDALLMRAGASFLQAVSDMDAMLASEIPSLAPFSMPQVTTVNALTAAARQREANVKSRRDLAVMLVVGALDNHDNPQWDPADPASNRRDAPPHPLLAILGITPAAQN